MWVPRLFPAGRTARSEGTVARVHRGGEDKVPRIARQCSARSSTHRGGRTWVVSRHGAPLHVHCEVPLVGLRVV